MPKAKNGNPNLSSGATGCDKRQTLTDLGITRDQSSTWQQLAAVPQEEFEEAVSKTVSLSARAIVDDHKNGLFIRSLYRQPPPADIPTLRNLAEIRDQCNAKEIVGLLAKLRWYVERTKNLETIVQLLLGPTMRRSCRIFNVGLTLRPRLRMHSMRLA